MGDWGEVWRVVHVLNGNEGEKREPSNMRIKLPVQIYELKSRYSYHVQGLKAERASPQNPKSLPMSVTSIPATSTGFTPRSDPRTRDGGRHLPLPPTSATGRPLARSSADGPGNLSISAVDAARTAPVTARSALRTDSRGASDAAEVAAGGAPPDRAPAAAAEGGDGGAK